MFKVYNHYLQREEMVSKIDLNKHWKAYLVPFDSIPEEEEIEIPEHIEIPTGIEWVTYTTEDITPKKKGRHKAN